MPSRGGITEYTDPGKIDFDTALQLLNPYGTWSKIDDKWAYTPLDHLAPYTSGRWIYTEYGWYWKSSRPHGWATEHYGYWRRSEDKVWSWYPGPYWLPQIVEMRATTTHIGWRSGAVDRDGNFLERPADRYAKTDEWTFVTKAHFADPITPGTAATPETARQQLEDSTECRHTYLTYRVIDRPGPHPADFLGLGDGGAFAPMTLEDEAKPPPATPIIPGLVKTAPIKTPALMGSVPDASTDKRQVKYWLTRSLPGFWAKPPADAKPSEIYIYRPDFFQDDDGIARRISLWFNPQSRTSLKELLGDKLPGIKPDAGDKSKTTAPAIPQDKGESAFRSPFDDSYRPGDAPKTPNQSSKKSAPPAGLKAEVAPAPTTNATPVNQH